MACIDTIKVILSDRLCVSSCPSVDLVLKGSKNRIIDAGGGHGDDGGGG